MSDHAAPGKVEKRIQAVAMNFLADLFGIAFGVGLILGLIMVVLISIKSLFD